MDIKSILSNLTIEQKAALLQGWTTWTSLDLTEKGIPPMFMSDGPVGLRKQAGAGDHLGLNESVPATCFPTAAGMANTWNVELGEALGTALGKEAAANDVHVVLGPGLNIKRSPLCGRNFEYFSEDPYLAGKMAAAYTKGIQSNGVAACPKHFAVNSQELRRMAMDSVVDERTMREIYLTGFEMAVKEGHAQSIMSAYNMVNGTYANENEHLLSDILRKEWGNNGMSITDNVITPMVTGADGVLAGTTTYDAMLPNINNELPGYENDPVIVSAMREACHHNLYALANSSAMNGIGPDTVIKAKELPLIGTVRTVMIILWVLFAATLALWILGKKKWKKTEAYLNYQTMKNALKAEKKQK